MTVQDQLNAWHEAWKRVPEEYQAYKKQWPKAATSIIVINVPVPLVQGGTRYYFRHYTPELELNGDGTLGAREKIDLFLLPIERCGTVEVLGRAFLGSIYIRLSLADEQFAEANPDIKEWAESHWAPLSLPPACV